MVKAVLNTVMLQINMILNKQSMLILFLCFGGFFCAARLQFCCFLPVCIQSRTGCSSFLRFFIICWYSSTCSPDNHYNYAHRQSTHKTGEDWSCLEHWLRSRRLILVTGTTVTKILASSKYLMRMWSTVCFGFGALSV